MKCKDCRFSLLCHAGRLDGDDGELVMCPVCEKLVVMRHTGGNEITFYFLDCEERPYRPYFRNEWRDPKHVTLNAAKRTKDAAHSVAEILVNDPMRCISGKIRMHPCWKCEKNNPYSMWRVRDLPGMTARFIDLDEVAQHENQGESQRHVWSLTPSRRK